MADVFNHDWYDRNSIRQYPLDMSATGIDDFGNPITTALLEDVNIYVPESLNVVGVYVGGGHITESMTSVVLTGWVPGGRIPLCSAVATTGSSRLVSVDPLVDGVRGWVVMGKPNANDTGRWTFSSALQSILSEGCWSTYRRPPVTSLGAANRLQRLISDVGLQAGGHLELVADNRLIYGKSTRVFVLRLDPTLPEDTKASYVGVCVSTDGVCSPAPVQTINKVKPDADGNITIEVKGISLKSLVDTEGRVLGIVMESPLGMIDICDVNKGLELDPIDVPEC